MSQDVDAGRVEALTAAQTAALAERTHRSGEYAKVARETLASGVACSWHDLSPHPLYASHGDGSTLWDLDGNAYVDMHCGFGVMVVGHAHPAVVAAVRERVGLGTHFAMPVEETLEVAELLRARFGLPLWRFQNSGSEATMDAVRIARAATGRDLIVKVEGSYHGSPDGLAFSYWEEREPTDAPTPHPNTAGVPEAFGQALRIVEYNDLESVRRVFADEGDRIAGMILEPVLMNAGVILPDPGYLEGLRDITRRHEAMLIFDEVKTGVTIAPGGATERFGVTPDLVALAKAIGGGLPIGAVGGTDAAMAVIVDGTMEQEGTFNGNPLSMAAAKATLTQVLTDDVYPRFDQLDVALTDPIRASIDRWELPATVASISCRGMVQFRAEPVRRFMDHRDTDHDLTSLHWLYQVNGGVFTPKGDPWTFSVRHTEEDLGRYAENFEAFASALRA